MRKLPDMLLILLVLLLIVSGQILAKTGSLSTDGGLMGFAGLNLILAASYGVFLIRGALWAWVLRRNPVNRVYPYLSLAYPLILISGFLFFDEIISLGNILGTLLILGGTVLLATGEKK